MEFEMPEIRGGEEDHEPAPAPAAVADGDSVLGAVQPLIDHEDGHLLAAAAAAVTAGGEGLGGALQKLIDFGDPRLRATSFFLGWGYCVLINAMFLNPAANLEQHKFVGFVVLTIGAWLALLTLGGAGAGRAAARAEAFLRGFF